MSTFSGKTATEIDPQQEAARYWAAWKKFSASSRWYWFPFLTYIPGVFLFGWLLSFVLNDNLAHGIVASLWAVLWVFGSWIHAQFICPRCGKKFFRCGNYFYSGKGFSTIFTSKCLNCGLHAYAPNSHNVVPKETFQPPLSDT